jgi:hypothetical protein
MASITQFNNRSKQWWLHALNRLNSSQVADKAILGSLQASFS